MQWTRFPSRRFIRSIRNHLAAPPQDPAPRRAFPRPRIRVYATTLPPHRKIPGVESWERGRPARSGPKVRGRRPATWQSGRGKAGIPPALVIPAIPAPLFPRKRESRCPENAGIPPASSIREPPAPDLRSAASGTPVSVKDTPFPGCAMKDEREAGAFERQGGYRDRSVRRARRAPISRRNAARSWRPFAEYPPWRSRPPAGQMSNPARCRRSAPSLPS